MIWEFFSFFQLLKLTSSITVCSIFYMRYYTGGNKIELSLSKSKWRKILEAVGANEKELSEEDAKNIFCLSFEFFLEGKLSIDDISSICSRLLEAVKDKVYKYPELLDGLEAGSELGFYVRDINLISNFKNFLEEVFSVYDSIRSHRE